MDINTITFPYHLKLEYPVCNDKGETVLEELVMERRPTAKTLKPLLGAKFTNDAKNAEDALFQTVASAFAVETWKIENLDMTDFMEAVEVVMGFLPDGMKMLGEAPSESSPAK
ncbi:MAG: phage tail assembly protein [Proteobacteria bacterium]|nr:phage tail assembly protein [Pseudomonadota bacterium]